MPVSPTLQAIASVFGWINTQTQLKNAPDVRKAAIQQTKAEELDNIKKIISKEDTEETRKLLSR